MTNAHVKMHFPDGTSKEMIRNAGDVEAYRAGDNPPENLDDEVVEVALVELKGKE